LNQETKETKWPTDWGELPAWWEDLSEEHRLLFVEEAERIGAERRVHYINELDDCTEDEREAMIEWLPQINSGYGPGPEPEELSPLGCMFWCILLLALPGLTFFLF